MSQSLTAACERLRRMRCTVEFRSAKRVDGWRVNVLRNGTIPASEYCACGRTTNLSDALIQAQPVVAALQKLARRVEALDDRSVR